MKQKTAIRQLIEKLESIPLESDYYKLGIVAAIRIAHELESVNEQQIIDARAGLYADLTGGKKENFINLGEQYFNETFEKT